MAAPIQSPAKCEVHSVILFLNAKCERLTLWFPLISSPKETSRWEKIWWQWWGAI